MLVGQAANRIPMILYGTRNGSQGLGSACSVAAHRQVTRNWYAVPGLAVVQLSPQRHFSIYLQWDLPKRHRVVVFGIIVTVINGLMNKKS